MTVWVIEVSGYDSYVIGVASSPEQALVLVRTRYAKEIAAGSWTLKKGHEGRFVLEADGSDGYNVLPFELDKP